MFSDFEHTDLPGVNPVQRAAAEGRAPVTILIGVDGVNHAYERMLEEARRAGDAGRGFEVVAVEVRSLALRAKEAAQKTEALIRQSVGQAAEGEVSAKAVSERLGQIVAAVGGSTERVARISALLAEQVRRADGVSRAMADVDKVTQQNAASAEQSSSAAEELSGQARALEELVGAFHVDGAALPAPRRPGTLPAARRNA